MTTSLAQMSIPSITSHNVTGKLAVHSELEIDGVVSIADDATVLPVLALLRQAAAVAATVHWSLELTRSLPTWHLAHLPPPQQASGMSAADLETWRSRFTFGHCYYRRGPRFITVYDARRQPPVRQTISAPANVSAVEQLNEPRQILSLDAALRDVLPGLTRSGLVLQLGGWAMTLPWRPTRWPVPCTL